MEARVSVNVPVYRKVLLTVKEAADYSGLGVNKIREITDEENLDFVVQNGNKRLIKRELFKEYLLDLETYI